MSDNNKRSSLHLLCGKTETLNQCHKKFYGRNCQVGQKVSVFIPDRPFQTSLVFVNKAGTYPSEASFSCYTFGQAPGVKCGHRKFYNIGPLRLSHKKSICRIIMQNVVAYKTFYGRNLRIFVTS